MRKLIHRAIDRQELFLGASLDWMRELVRVSLSAFFKFALVAPLGNHRRCLPKVAWHIARLTATLEEDCGGCVQIVVNLALRDGIRAETLEAVLHSRIELLPTELADVHRFAKTICRGDDDPSLRDKLRRTFGEQGFMELALAIANSRLIPTTKRALGYAQSCSLIRITVTKPLPTPASQATARIA